MFTIGKVEDKPALILPEPAKIQDWTTEPDNEVNVRVRCPCGRLMGFLLHPDRGDDVATCRTCGTRFRIWLRIYGVIEEHGQCYRM